MARIFFSCKSCTVKVTFTNIFQKKKKVWSKKCWTWNQMTFGLIKWSILNYSAITAFHLKLTKMSRLDQEVFTMRIYVPSRWKHIMPGTEKLWGKLLFPEEKTISSERNKCSSQSFFDPGIMLSAWRIHFLRVSSSDLP